MVQTMINLLNSNEELNYLNRRLALNWDSGYIDEVTEHEICQMDCKTSVRFLRKHGYKIYWDKFYNWKYTRVHCYWLLFVQMYFHIFEEYDSIPLPPQNDYWLKDYPLHCWVSELLYLNQLD